MSDNFSLPDALNDNAGVIGFGIGTAALRNQARAQAGIEEITRTLKQRFKEEEENKAKLLNAKETLYQFIIRLEKYTVIESFPLKYLLVYKLQIDWIKSAISSKSFDEINDKLQFESFFNKLSNIKSSLEAYEDKNILQSTKTLIDYCNLVRDIKNLIACENEIRILENDIATAIPSLFKSLFVNPVRKYTIIFGVFILISLYYLSTWIPQGQDQAIVTVVAVCFVLLIDLVLVMFCLINASNINSRDSKILERKQLIQKNNHSIRILYKQIINNYDYIESETKRLFCKDDLLEKSDICFLDEIVQYRDQLAMSLGISDSFISDYVK